MHIRQSYEQISTPSSDDQVAAFSERVSLYAIWFMVTENQKPPCLLLKSPNADFAESNEVLLCKTRLCVWCGS